jgi:hypothetical protein
MRFWLALAVCALGVLLFRGAAAQAPIWYWCEPSHAYYPWVRSCPEGWRPVNPATVMPQPYGAIPSTAARPTAPQAPSAYPGPLAPGNAGPEWDRLHPAEAQRREEEASANRRQLILRDVAVTCIPDSPGYVGPKTSEDQLMCDQHNAIVREQDAIEAAGNFPETVTARIARAQLQFEIDIQAALARFQHRQACQENRADPGSC